jgi:hypothetical protein
MPANTFKFVLGFLLPVAFPTVFLSAAPAPQAAQSFFRRISHFHVAAYCLQYNLDPYWAQAIINVESR